MKIGFIGLGIMGFPMAENLIKAGFKLIVYNRTRAKSEALKSRGAEVASSPKEVAKGSDIIIVMVTDAPDVEEVIFGDNGVVSGARQGLIVIDMSTNSPEFSKSLAQRLSKYGVEFLDAPVTGGDKGAREATLTIMVGGKREIYEKVKKVFEAMGKTIIYCGETGSGQMMKLVNQVVVGLNMLAVVEGLALAEKAGLDKELVFKVLSSGAANSFTVQYYLPKILNGDFEPGFKAAHLKKDLKYVVDVASKYNVPLPGTGLLLQLYSSLVSMGYGEKGTQTLVKVYESLQGKDK